MNGPDRPRRKLEDSFCYRQALQAAKEVLYHTNQ